MVIKIFIILVVVLLNFQLLYGQEDKCIALIKSPVKMKEVCGDPLRVDALSAIIAASGGDMSDWKWRKTGIHPLKNQLGPFDSIVVTEFSTTNQMTMGYSHFTYGGQAARVVSKCTRKGMAFSDGKAILHSVRRSIKSEMGNVEFVDDGEKDGVFVIETPNPTYCGWRIKLLVVQKGDDTLEFTLELRRDFNGSVLTISPIEIDVDI